MKYSQVIDQIVPKLHSMRLTDAETGQVDLAEVELTVLSTVKRLAAGWDLDAFTTTNDGMFFTSTGTYRYSLPDDFGRLIVPREDNETGIYLYDGTSVSTLEYKDPEDFTRDRTTTNGVPSYFTIVGNEILIDPPPDNSLGSAGGSSTGFVGRGVYIVNLDSIEPDDDVLLADPMALVDSVVAEIAILRGHPYALQLEGKAQTCVMRLVNHQARVRQRFRPRHRTESGRL